MNVLQLGDKDLSTTYTLPEGIVWHFNDFDPKAKKQLDYGALIITSKPDFTEKEWEKLHWLIDPYCVFYKSGLDSELDQVGQYFLKSQAAQLLPEGDLQQFINDLPIKYFRGQSGARYSPTELLINDHFVNDYSTIDAHHLKMTVNTGSQWVNVGALSKSVVIDPQRMVNFWLEREIISGSVNIRLRLFVQNNGSDGDPNNNYVLDMDSDEEQGLNVKPSNDFRFVNVDFEMKGTGTVTIGNLHLRWDRCGAGEFLPGGKRLVDPKTHEDIAYIYNPGDLKPPLNVYFSGARGKEGFEAYPLMRHTHAPSLLFTDMRMSIGAFYTGKFFEQQIQSTIERTLKRLGFNKQDCVVNGISMGTYPAMKIGARIQAGVINVSKPIANLGHVAARGRLERPGNFDTIFDIDGQLLPTLSLKQLHQLDDSFWKEMSHCDLSHTRMFMAYMINDDYDNQAIDKWKHCPAIKKAKQFTYKGFPGRHNDDPNSINWLVWRVTNLAHNDFVRRYPDND